MKEEIANYLKDEIELCLGLLYRFISDKKKNKLIDYDIRKKLKNSINRKFIPTPSVLHFLKNAIEESGDESEKEAYHVMVYLRYKMALSDSAFISLKDFKESQKYLVKNNSQIYKRIRDRKKIYMNLISNVEFIDKQISVPGKEFASKLEKIREDKGLTKKAFADILGMSYSRYIDVSNGKAEVSQHNINTAIKGLNMSVEEILSYGE